ncbi:uncharacterized protein M421DRAFT_117842 [Didymella exigua CBS 183.55]|uniref:Uncharacterized protein n=1 Tax=Didymella exigua CBS 183.55 TaxID=1150837 RepID=A0A6A5S2Z3_9PLEO|nr:uncharacterized protein M421DRAFT_117842 [Didymella exigua CBS 183.55]KAF1934293.1 hypothetical protein M421DRAFT_117842 [Didymella exigua CBS 183.55]
MATAMRTLLPMFPPELRNSVYSYLSASATLTNTNIGLPLQLKSYSCKHTLIQLCPVHSGPTALLTLQRFGFLEGNEYRTWLLNHAITLRIGVVFKGRANTFVQEHWDKKMEVHLQKLAKQYPWLKKVARYDIQILWDAPDGVLKSKHNRRNAGQIPHAMVRTLTGLMDEGVRGKTGDVQIRLRLEHHVAGMAVRSSPRFGLGSFMTLPLDVTSIDCARQTLEVWKEPCPKVLPRKSARLTPVVTKAAEKEVLKCSRGTVDWVGWGQGTLVMSKTEELGKQTCTTWMDTGYAYDSPTELMLFELLEDCHGRR